MNHDDSLVSVLMPAYKPEHFKEALLSVVNQTHANLEILVGDNNGDGSIRAVVDEVADPRVVYVPTHAVTGGSPRINHMVLWWRARGRHARYVYDDDVIFPRSTEVLLGLQRQLPGCAFTWHQRVIIDEHGVVRGRHGALPDGGGPTVMDRPMLLRNLAQHFNFIGEPCFVMFDREVVRHFDFARHAGTDLVFLWDVAVYLEAGRYGLCAGSPEFLGGFRQHGGQFSSAQSPNFVYGCIEWELVFRQECVEGHLAPDDAAAALLRVARLYEGYKASVPVLAEFQQRLLADIVTKRIAETTPRFMADYRALRDRRRG
ncbi:glycosyltransferase family 2 protein [Azohydromonas caseinilytica]|uniref:Glycosyltransferase family 2 protein n=1 Tax=Azohydromonas caseinilytica TaxID=2728836 RepID=A0A848F7Y4_9BURK|nr:glycosyltransferase [Azohydromonas caseinilytica]NML14876.1 glycosyltransferase family 2 protein [Azohydromonas caseinilytica]